MTSERLDEWREAVKLHLLSWRYAKEFLDEIDRLTIQLSHERECSVTLTGQRDALLRVVRAQDRSGWSVHPAIYDALISLDKVWPDWRD